LTRYAETQEEAMAALTQVGAFCPNEACADYGCVQAAQQTNIIKYGTTQAGRQRYHCKTCGLTFAATKGTLFYRRRTAEHEILTALALLAEGSRISSVSRTSGHKEDTLLAWLRDAAQQVEAVEAVLLADYHVSRGQLDGLWAYVGHKGEKTLPPPSAARSGARP
jgi:transposase-like protein